ncbi:MAG: BCCT family transporter [Spirosomaceae bacterium]|nr:BCCT family transporter [Spirosomataceae bacterium]
MEKLKLAANLRNQFCQISICTTIATGLLFWGTAEPLFHVRNPPLAYADAENKNVFALSALYMHWSILPYAIYTLAGVAFAIGFYNKKLPFRIGTMWFELSKNGKNKTLYNIFDGLSLFSLVAGMAASLGVGILLLTNGVARSFNLSSNGYLMAIITILLVGTFVISSVSGLQKGIAKLSSLNFALFIILLFFFVLNLNYTEVLPLVGKSINHFFTNGFGDSMLYFSDANKQWATEWTVFNWSNWMAWTPITALFLGRISYGRTIRQFINVNLLLPSLFGIIWLSIVSGTALISNKLNNNVLTDFLQVEDGVSSIIFYLINELHFSSFLIPLFLLTVFLSFVTAADSNTDAMSNLSTEDFFDDDTESPKNIKIIWGVFIGVLAFVMVSFSGEEKSNGLEGVKILSNIGGIFALFILIGVAINMVIYLFKKSDVKEDS